jgi:hypothetical protein
VHNLPAKIAQIGGFPCRACGKTFNHLIARAGHERHCKSKIFKEALDEKPVLTEVKQNA